MPDENLAPAAAQAANGSASPQDAPPAGSDTPAAGSEPAAAAEAPQGDEATPGESAAPPAAQDDAQPAGEQPATKPRKPADQRIREVVAERDFWREQALKGNGAEKPAAAAPAAPPEPEKPPKIEDFEDVNQWSAALAAYHERRTESLVTAGVERALGKKDAATQAQTIQERFEARQDEFAKTTPDYAEVIADPELARLTTPEISAAVVEDEMGPQMAYHLATHRDELQAIRKLTPRAQQRALGALATRLKAATPANGTPAASAAAPAKKSVQQTRAPAPPTPVGSATPTKRITDDMPIGEYMASRTWAYKTK